MSKLFANLTRQLQQQQRRYVALSPINRPWVHIQFPGHFQGQEVVWDAQLRTLRSLFEERISPDTDITGISLRQFIHIQHENNGLLPITVALNVPQFDEPAILKTIIMIHNYKRLHLGRHEYGEPVKFTE